VDHNYNFTLANFPNSTPPGANVLKVLLCPSDYLSSNSVDRRNTARHYGLTSYKGNAGTRAYHNSVQSRDGVFHEYSGYTIQGISDGTSNTLLFGEGQHFDPIGEADGSLRLFAWAWWGFRAPGDVLRGTPVPINYRLPANYPTTTGATRTELQHLRINAFGSNHSGGANFTFGDGSVRFISDSIALITLQALSTRSKGEVVSNF
jgi:prepilin-type processing-associated H-X9-DG protein